MALGALALLFHLSENRGYARRFWYPYVVSARGARTHGDVIAELTPRLKDRVTGLVTDAGLSFPPSHLRLVALKEEKTIEVWGTNDEAARIRDQARWSRITSYRVLAASGGAGPKLREGDLQVPEGVYRLTAFNPNSSYHLSIRVDYPNADDRVNAAADGRTNLGGDIFIHGKAVSIGCLAIGDDAIEELYLLVDAVGLAKSEIVIAPNAEPTISFGTPKWLPGVYEKVRREMRLTRGAKPTASRN